MGKPPVISDSFNIEKKTWLVTILPQTKSMSTTSIYKMINIHHVLMLKIYNYVYKCNVLRFCSSYHISSMTICNHDDLLVHNRYTAQYF